MEANTVMREEQRRAGKIPRPVFTGQTPQAAFANGTVMEPARRAMLGGLMALFFPASGFGRSRTERLVVYYSDQEPPSAFAPYRCAVLDGEIHPPLPPIAKQGTTLYGYLSAGEAERGRGAFAAAQAAGLLLEENPNWPNSLYADVRHPEWRRLVLEDLVPPLLAKGFHGVFLDTLDNASFLEARDPVRFAGMTEGAARLVREIRQRFPGCRLMLNRGYDIQPAVAPHIDAVLAESVYGGYDFANRRYQETTPEDARWQLDKLAQLSRDFPKVGIFTLDYWDPEDREGIRRIYTRQRRNGYVPYVATIDLHRIVPEPRG
jgi:uncharacterized protein (TIGR01370 family)